MVIATQQRRWLAWTATLLAGLALLVADTARVSAELPPVPAPGDAADPMARPAPDEPLRDLAGVLSSAEFRTLRQSIRDLRDDTGVPVYALVLNHIPPAADGPIAPVNADDASLARFLQRLFVRLGDRHPLLQDADWSAGVVLAIAPAARRARVSFGPGWNDAARRAAAGLAPAYAAPAFRRGHYARGLDQLLHATGALIRGEPLPPPPGALWRRVVWIGAAAVAGLAVLGFWHRPTGRRTLRLARALLGLPHAALNRAAGRSAAGPRVLYPPPPSDPAGATVRW